MTLPQKTDSTRATPVDSAVMHDLPEATRRHPVAAYGIAAALTLAAFALTLLIRPFIERAVFLAFWPAIIATAWLCGFGPALVASVAAVLLVDYFLIPPPGFDVSNPEEIATLAAFLVIVELGSLSLQQGKVPGSECGSRER